MAATSIFHFSLPSKSSPSTPPFKTSHSLISSPNFRQDYSSISFNCVINNPIFTTFLFNISGLSKSSVACLFTDQMTKTSLLQTARLTPWESSLPPEALVLAFIPPSPLPMSSYLLTPQLRSSFWEHPTARKAQPSLLPGTSSTQFWPLR